MRVHILVPAQRYVFAVSNGEAEAAAVDSSAEGFQRYKQLQEGGRTLGMVAFPNTLQIRGSATTWSIRARSCRGPR